MGEHSQSFDICIVCALAEEANAVVHEFSDRYENIQFQQAFSEKNRYPYRYTTLKNSRAEPLRMLVVGMPFPGPVEMALNVRALLDEFHPRFVAMTGICAGYREKVALGDLVAASYAFYFDEGKVGAGEDGQDTLRPEWRPYGPPNQIIQYLQAFTIWEPPLIEMKERLLGRKLQPVEYPRCFIAPIASSMAVQENNPFSRLLEGNRKAMFLDQEVAAFYHALHEHPDVSFLAIKSVCDYADLTKNDDYHEYAAHASAVYLLLFIQEYVTQETMPRRDPSPDLAEQSVWTVPFQRHPFFTGQELVLAQLADMLKADQVAALTQPQALTGLGGIGKTQIAAEYAWRHRRDYQYVLWSRADTHEALVSGYVALAGHLNLPEKEAKDQDIIVQAVLRWFSAHVSWLLILDNADDLTVLNCFLPLERQGHLLLTTRTQATGMLAHPLEVEVMPPDIGATLLLRRAKLIVPDASLDAASSADSALAHAISEELGGLPLALDQAGAYIEETHCSLAAYQERYRSHRPALLKRRGSSIHDYPASVATTWSLSFAKVEQQNPIAAELLRCCAFLHPDAIPEELFTAGAVHLGPGLRQVAHDPLVFDEGVRVLLSYSLIRRDPHAATLSIHRLVQAVLLDTLSVRSRKQWQGRVVRALATIFPERVRYQLAICVRLLPHALICVPWIEHEAKPTRAAKFLLTRTGVYLRERGQYAEAKPLLLRSLVISEQQLGSQHPDTANSLNSLAVLYWQQGKYEQAEPLFQRALAIREQQLGLDHPDTARSLHNLAILYWQQGKYKQAEPLFQRSLAICEQQLGPDDPDTSSSLNSLGLLFLTQGKYEQAESLLQRSLAIREQRLGPNHPDTAMSLTNLAILYRNQGKYEQAESLFLRALTIREPALVPTHPDLAENFHEFAILRQAQGHYDEARSLYERALDARTQTLGPAHPHTTDTRERLIALLHNMSRTEEAAELEKKQAAHEDEQDQCRQKAHPQI